MSDINSLVSKIVSDRAFCEALVANPEQTLRASGVTVTPEILAALGSLDAASIQRLASAFGKQQAAA